MSQHVTGRIQRTNKDFDAIKAEMISKIPELAPLWTNLNEGDMGMVLINMVAGVGDMLSFYLDRYAEEMYLPLARSRESVKNIARLIDYRLSRPMAARTTLRFSLKAALSSNLTIPARTVVKTKKDIHFVTQREVTIFAGQTSVEVEALQGRLVTDTFSGTGETTQAYTLSRPNAAQNYLHVTVGGQTWTEDTREIDYLADGLYEVQTDVNEVASIIFSGHLGSVPPQTSNIQAAYLETLGDRGNIGAGLVSIIVTTFAGSDLLSVSNTDNASGGEARETVESARNRAPRYLRTMNRAVTLQDFVDLLELQPGVAKAQAINHHGYVELYVAPENQGPLYIKSETDTRLSQQSTNGTIPAGTYYALVTYVDASGNETADFEYNPADRAVVNAVKSITLASGTTNRIGTTRPGAVGTLPEGAVKWRMYLGTSPTTMRLLGERGPETVGVFWSALPASTQPLAPTSNTTGPRSQDGITSLRISCERMLEERRLVGSVFALFNPSFTAVNVTTTVKIYDNYRQTEVRGRVENALREFFGFSNRSFGEEIAVSDLYSVIKDVEGVRAVDLAAPTADVALGKGEIARAGTLTISVVGGIS